MNILDENIPQEELLLLRSWRIVVQHIRFDLEKGGMSDADIIRFLHGLRQPTFFTQDEDFYKRRLIHAGYCLVWLDVDDDVIAKYVRRFLRHPEFNTKAKRMGSLIKVAPDGLLLWKLNVNEPLHYPWPPRRR